MSARATVPLDEHGACGWCGRDPNGLLCCQGRTPERYALDAEYAKAPLIMIGRADIGRPRNAIGGATR